MKLLVDAHIGHLIVRFLECNGHDVLRANTFTPGTSDTEILRRAHREGRVVLTSDKDFGELVFRLQQPAAGIILLRIDVPHETDRLAVLEKFWPDIEKAVNGFFVVVANRSVRRTPLP